MTSPTGGSQHVSRYRALGEFDSLIRAAREARNELRKLREEEAKLNAASLADDKKLIASKQARAKADEDAAKAAKNTAANLNRDNSAGKAGEQAGTQYSRGMGKGIADHSRSTENRNFVTAATNALKDAFAAAGETSGKEYTRKFRDTVVKETQGPSSDTIINNSVKKLSEAFGKAGDDAGKNFTVSVRERFRKDSNGFFQSSGFEYSFREFIQFAKRAGQDTGYEYVTGIGEQIKKLNQILSLVGQDKLELDVDTEDAVQSVKALEIELKRLANTTADPAVRIDANRALVELRSLQKLFKDEVAEEIIKDAERIRKELIKLDGIPSGRAFKFWSLTALSDMSRVFEEADRGTSVFRRLTEAIAAAGGGSGGGGNIIRSLISGFDDFSESSSRLLQRLGRVSGELYRMPGVIAVLVASIPALTAGLGAIAGSAGAVASALGASLGIVAAMPAAIIGLSTTVGVLSSAFGGMGDAIKAAEKAQEEELEAKEKARLGTDKALTAQQKYNLALEQMAPATQKSTEAIVDFAEAWRGVSSRVGESFFKEVVGDSKQLNDLLPMLEGLLTQAATALGNVADAGLKMVTSGPWKSDFKEIAKSNAVFLEQMGFAGLEVADAFRNIAVAAIPFTTWLVKGIREGAEAFADWSATARANGTISAFLGETQESLQILWQIFKDLGNVVNSFFKTTVDEGQVYLKTLEEITSHWADVAKAQEAANSPLREWMVQIRPVMSALGALIGDLARGIAGLATNQNSIQSMIDLLDSLRTDVLPPILSILQHLNDSGIAVTVVEALGTILEAIATFLESGATQALSVFVTVLASFVELLAEIASLPGISDVLGAAATGIAAIAAVSIVARFTGLFKLWDFFNWMTRNRGNLSGAFADAARNAAGLAAINQGPLPANIPSTIANGPGLGGIGSEVRNDPSRSITNTGNAAQANAGKVGIFSRAVAGITTAGNKAGQALGSLTSFIGGPWMIALAGAAVGIGVIAADIQKQKQDVEDTRAAWMALADAYDQLQAGDTSGVEGLTKSNEKFRELADSADYYGITLADLSGALNGNEQAAARVNSVLDAQAAAYKENDVMGNANRQTAHLNMLGLKGFRDELDRTVNAQKEANRLTNQSVSFGRTYQERLGGMTQAQVDTSVSANDMSASIRTLSGALDTMSNASSTSTDRAKALSDIIGYTKDPLIAANEAAENFNSSLLNLSEAAESNGRSLNINSRAGLRNRDALQEAAKATRDLYLEDIASGTPMDEALKRHEKRIKRLTDEAEKTYGQKKAVKELIDTYGDIPENMKTNIIPDEKGFAAVFAELSRIQIMQTALQQGKSLSQAEDEWRKKSSNLYQRYIPAPATNNGPKEKATGFATGGPVWGAGSKTSDSIRAWLSNGEFVQPADSVDYYGLPLMEAIRKKKLDKASIFEALPSENNATYASGGKVHSDNCMSCQSGGHKFAQGGTVRVPIMVNPRNTLVDKDWANIGAGQLGGGGGGRGWQWQMNVLRQAFPGLELWSGFRRGSRTLSGNLSYHAQGRAVDIAPRRDVAAWIRSNYGAKTRELITPYNDLNIWNGKPHRYTGAVWNQHNFAGGNAHNHWAFNQGGLVDLMEMMNMTNLAPRQNTSLPTAPRTLSPAASSVVNNSTDNTRTFGDVIINNPMPERAGDSVRDALFRTTLLY
jgi:hypothetical protein